jgi:arylsulfatase
MEVYAAMVDRMDQGIGRVLEQIETSGLAQRTLVMFLSDNGGCRSEGVPHTSHLDMSGPIGSERSFTAYGHGWANLSNTPFRLFKATMFEGGIASPFIAWCPRVLPAGEVFAGPAHVVDLMSTCLDVAGVEYPARHRERAIPPTAGVSLVPLLQGSALEERVLFWEHLGARAVRDDPWKLVALGDEDPWELYHLGRDPTERHDLAATETEEARRLQARYEEWAAGVGVVSSAEREAHRLEPK